MINTKCTFRIFNVRNKKKIPLVKILKKYIQFLYWKKQIKLTSIVLQIIRVFSFIYSKSCINIVKSDQYFFWSSSIITTHDVNIIIFNHVICTYNEVLLHHKIRKMMVKRLGNIAGLKFVYVRFLWLEMQVNDIDIL